MKKIYLFAVIFALITGFATYFFVNNLKHNSNVTGVEEANVVVALQDIEPDTVVKPEMFRTVKLPVTSITYGTLVNISDVEGYVATEKIFKGEQVLASKLTLIDKDKDGLEYNGEYRLSYHLEKGNYAYTLRINDSDAVAHFIRRGDYVNVYFNSNAVPQPKEKPILRNIKVLEIGTYSDYKASTTGVETASYTLVTLSLKEDQIKKILDYENELDDGRHFALALVPYSEGAGLTTLPEKTTVNEFGETEKVTRVMEPATNRGMGEIETTTTTTTKAS